MKWQTTDSVLIAPLALTGLLLTCQAHATETTVKQQRPKQQNELLRQLARDDAQAAKLQRKIEQLEARRDALSAAVARMSSHSPSNAASTLHPTSRSPASTFSARPTLLAQAARQDMAAQSTAETSSSGSSDAPSSDGAFEVDEEAAQRALERTLTQTGALLLPSGVIELTPSYSYRRDEARSPVPATFTPSGGTPTTVLVDRRTRRNENIARVEVRAGMPYDTQLEVGFPYEYVRSSQVTDFGDTTSTSGSGTGDLTLGIAKTLMREEGWKPDVISRATYDFGNGERRDGTIGLNGGYRELQLELVGIKRQDPLAFVGSVFVAKSFEEDDILPGNVAGFSLTAVLAASPATSLQFGFTQVHREEQEMGGREIDGSDQTYGMLNIGASSVLSRDVTLVTSFGIGLGDDAPEYTFTVSLPFLLR